MLGGYGKYKGGPHFLIVGLRLHVKSCEDTENITQASILLSKLPLAALLVHAFKWLCQFDVWLVLVRSLFHPSDITSKGKLVAC